MAKQDWVWMPHPGHFIAAQKCLFKMTTAVNGGKYIVSSVGEYFNENGKQEYIGFGRKYETYVFESAKAKPEDANCGCPYRPANWREIDSLGANLANECVKNHMELCEKWDAK